MPNSAEQPEFIRRQYQFAAHIRNPDKNPRPDDIEDRRMGIYRELFYNNIEGFLASSFPVLRELTNDTDWQAMARDFISRHESHSPLFLEIPREFLHYLEHERGAQDRDPPFLLELAHYEWVELALSVSDIEWPAPVEPDGDLLDTIPVLSPLAWPLSYHFPVHRISKDFQPDAPDAEPTYLLVYRNRDDEVGFAELNPVSARLFSLAQDNRQLNGRELLLQIAGELQHPAPDTVVDGGKQILEDWRTLGVVCDTRTPVPG